MKAAYAILMLSMPTIAFAYVDAGSGSYLLQVGIAGLMGGLFALKLAWQSVRERACATLRIGTREHKNRS